MALSITKLPKELLALIFEHLTETNDRRRAAQVCKLFYDIIRHQSTLKRDNMLWMKADSIRVFEKSEWFPFSKLCINNWHQNIILESAFWSLHGGEISEIIIRGEKTDAIETFLSACRDYFPNLVKLTVQGNFSVSSDADNNAHTVSLPIEELIFGVFDISLEKILTFLRCSSQLKNLEITWMKADYLPQILPWLETIESSRLNFRERIRLVNLINLPSKVLIGELTIKFDETPESIRAFFKQPRTIDTLSIQSKHPNDEFVGHGEGNANNPAVVYFTRDHTCALGSAKSIKKVDLPLGVLEFEGSLDFLARLPGLESISLRINNELPNPLSPFYWSSPKTAQKIREISIFVSKVDYLMGLSSLTSINISPNEYNDPTAQGLSSDEIQTLIRNCPNLKDLFLQKIDATDADLIGHGDLLPISSLEKLISLQILNAPNITSEAFKGAFKFPNLKSFDLYNYNSSEEEPFNQDVAKQFTQNCPNLEMLNLHNCPINEEGFDYLSRHLPYLSCIAIQPKSKRHPSGSGNVVLF